jgi:hypothetical protein
VSDRMDAPIRRWIKTGLAGRRPPVQARAQVLRAAAEWASARDRRHALMYSQWVGGQVGEKPREWHLGVARQTAMDRFPMELAPLRLVY